MISRTVRVVALIAASVTLAAVAAPTMAAPLVGPIQLRHSDPPPPTSPGVPEPGVWAMLMVGFAGLGVALRNRRSVTA